MRLNNVLKIALAIAAAAVIASCGPARQPNAPTSPTPAPAALPTPLTLGPTDPPQILAVQLSDPVFHSGETITGTVITSTNVAAVDLDVLGRDFQIPRMSAGLFQVTAQVPQVPFFLRRTYTAQVIAKNAIGLTAERDLSVSVR